MHGTGLHSRITIASLNASSLGFALRDKTNIGSTLYANKCSVIDDPGFQLRQESAVYGIIDFSNQLGICSNIRSNSCLVLQCNFHHNWGWTSAQRETKFFRELRSRIFSPILSVDESKWRCAAEVVPQAGASWSQQITKQMVYFTWHLKKHHVRKVRMKSWSWSLMENFEDCSPGNCNSRCSAHGKSKVLWDAAPP